MIAPRASSRRATLGRTLLILVAAGAFAAPLFAPNRPTDQFRDHNYAPPMRLRIHDTSGFHAPFVYRQVLVNRIMKEYGDDPASRVTLRWFTDGRLLSIADADGPLLLLGADALGRDIFSRLLFGAQQSLGVTALGAIGALLLGGLVGGLAGSAGGRVESALMFAADFMLVLPAVYLVLAFRATLSPVLPWGTLVLMLAALFTLVGWPRVARGVRGIVAVERTRDYVTAARAAGASRLRILRHVLPAARGFLGVELVLLVPAMLLAETTLSYLGLGFPEETPSWGTMLQDASNVRMMGDAPWLLAPAVALFIVVLALQLAGTSFHAGRELGPRPGL